MYAFDFESEKFLEGEELNKKVKKDLEQIHKDYENFLDTLIYLTKYQYKKLKKLLER